MTSVWRHSDDDDDDDGEDRDDEPVLPDTSVALVNARHVLRRVQQTLRRSVDAVADVVDNLVLKVILCHLK